MTAMSQINEEQDHIESETADQGSELVQTAALEDESEEEAEEDADSDDDIADEGDANEMDEDEA